MLTAMMRTPKENMSDAGDKGLHMICSGLAQLKVYLGPCSVVAVKWVPVMNRLRPTSAILAFMSCSATTDVGCTPQAASDVLCSALANM